MAKLDWYIKANLKPRHMQLLVALDNFRHFGQAAQYLNVSQPAISKSLAEIETGLGFSLFERSPRGLRLTPHGECLVRYSRTILAELAHARDELHAISNGVVNRVAVGMLPGISLTLMPKVISKLKETSPETAVITREAQMDALRALLRTGEIDLIVGLMPDRSQAHDVDSQTLYKDPMILAVGQQHAPENIDTIGWKALEDYLWIMPPIGSLVREPIELILEQNEIPFPANHVESISVILNVGVLQSTRAVGFLPTEVVKQFRSYGQLIGLPLSLPTLAYEVGAMWSKERALSPGAERMLRILEETVVGLPGAAAT
ncbi:LysR family transcriptional regulator [Massilia horti]|uniref:LysR family transcriptional regulator n=1 Tax=Massilia horti TaxID=2562153 RepID=A0A4Y9T4R5_9BURK|nr:LysR family transcriptional regulator [Massilia horti]TFW32901.1 LysR family transcriptional regulator [Massilia horti]